MAEEQGAAEQGAAGTPDGINGNVLLYRKPEPLSVERHAKLGLMRTGEHLAFARATNFVPIVAGEFASCSADYPIVFAGEKYSPVAVLGLREGQNVFVRANGSLEPHVYAPSYLRRYPFVLATHPQGNAIVCIDRAHETIQENGDIPFFEDGQPSEFTRNAVQFLQAFEEQRVLTERMIEELRKLDLFEPMTSQYTPADSNRGLQQPVTLAQFVGINEAKVRALDAATLKDLLDKGYLAVIFAHLMSLNNWQKLVSRSIEYGFLPNGSAAPAEAVQAQA